MKRSQPRRDWSDAQVKRVPCRVCGAWPVDLAHVVGRKHDRRGPNQMFYVRPESVVGLCREHHSKFDAHELDLLPYLTLEEQLDAVRSAGGIELARVRLAPSQYRKEAVA